MRGTSPSVQVDVGDAPRVICAGTNATTVILANAHVTLFGTLAQRQELVMEMARELGLTLAIAAEREAVTA